MAPQTTARVMGRFDFNRTDRTQMFFRYAFEDITDFNGSDYSSVFPQYNVSDACFNNGGLFSLSHTYKPNLFSNSKISFHRFTFKNTVVNPAVLSVPELLVSPAPDIINGIPVQLPGTFAQFAGTGGLPFGGPQNVLQLLHDMSWTRGAHTVRFGGLYDYRQMNRALGAYVQAIEQLGSSAAAGLPNLATGDLALFQVAIDPKGHLPCHRDPVTGMLIATADCTRSLPTGQPTFARSYRYRDWAAYLEDSWKLTPRLTFNYGVRYEYFGV